MSKNKNPKSKINTYINSTPYREIRKLSIDLDVRWSDLLELGVWSVAIAYRNLLEKGASPSKAKEEIEKKLALFRESKED